MAKRKSNKSTTANTTTSTEVKQEETVETPVVEEVSTDNDVVDTITADKAEVEDAEIVSTTPTTETETDTVEEVKEELPPVTPEPVKKEETVSKSGKQEINGAKADVQVELAKTYKVKFAQSYFMKTVAATKIFSLFSILETWMINRTAYIGLLSLNDFNHIKEFMLNNTITYKYKVIDAAAKKQFIEKLEFNTQYAVSHK